MFVDHWYLSLRYLKSLDINVLLSFLKFLVFMIIEDDLEMHA